jgi:dipeptidyl-peptidase-4
MRPRRTSVARHPAGPVPAGTARAAAVLVTIVLAAAPYAHAQDPRTGAEASGFERHTTYDEMMDFLGALRARSPDMRLSTYGRTREGRALPYAIFSRPMVTRPAEAAALGRPVILLAANVHGGERTLRESLLLLLRDIATPGTPENAWLDDVVILAAPQLNPDGFHASPRGTRGNAWGIDLNRDYIKLEHPEIAAYVANLIHGWRPHLFVDGHNGGSFPYNINYQCPSHASVDPRITALCDDALFPAIDRRLQAAGYQSWYYAGGTRTRWNTGGFQARIGRNYGGFVNSVGVLFESPGGQPLETGVRSGIIAFQAVIDWVRANAAELMATVDRARRETVAMGLAAEGEVVVEMRYGPEPRRVQYRIAEGEGDERRVIDVTSDSLMKRPIATKTRPRPYAYLLPREAVDAVALLRRHGITVEQLVDSVRVPVAAYVLSDVRYEQVYDHAAATIVTLGDVVAAERTFPRDTYVVPTGQPLGRLVAHMLEPETDDNVIYWNRMDAWLPKARLVAATAAADADGDAPPGQPPRPQGPPLVPIYKLMTPTPLPSRILP